MVKYADLNPRFREDPSALQRLVEGQHLNTRTFLHGYELPLEGQRNKLQKYREEVLESDAPDRERRIRLRAIDDLWADYLARVADFKSGVHWISWTGRDPHHEYLCTVHEWFGELEANLEEEIARRMASPGDGYASRGAVWTYLTSDEPFASFGRALPRNLRNLAAVYLFGG